MHQGMTMIKESSSLCKPWYIALMSCLSLIQACRSTLGAMWQWGSSHSSQHCIVYGFLYCLERLALNQTRCWWFALKPPFLWEISTWPQITQCPSVSLSTDPASFEGGGSTAWVQKGRNMLRGVHRVHAYLPNSHSSHPQMGLSFSSKHCLFP